MTFTFVNLGAQVQNAAGRVRAANPLKRAPQSFALRVLYGIAAIVLAIPLALLILALVVCGFACIVVVIALVLALALIRAALRIFTSSQSTRDLSRPDASGRENVRVKDSA